MPSMVPGPTSSPRPPWTSPPVAGCAWPIIGAPPTVPRAGPARRAHHGAHPRGPREPLRPRPLSPQTPPTTLNRSGYIAISVVVSVAVRLWRSRSRWRHLRGSGVRSSSGALCVSLAVSRMGGCRYHNVPPGRGTRQRSGNRAWSAQRRCCAHTSWCGRSPPL